MNYLGLKDETLLQIGEVISSHLAVVNAVIFGSRAKGNYKKYSDIDICLYGSVDPEETERIKIELSDLDIIYKCDVVAYENISNPELKEHITRCGVEFYIAGTKMQT